MTTPLDPAPDAATLAALQSRFAWFAAHDAPAEPLYAALTAGAATHAHRAVLLAAAPPTQRLPVLWLAALHDRVLELAERGERPALADYYASVGGTRAPDAALDAVMDDFLARERAALLARIATRATQTNEIGRCAVLRLVLRELAHRTGRARLALLDVGCSAGLNLGVDAWGYRWLDDAGAVLARTDGAPVIDSRVVAGSGVLPEGADPAIVERLGIDRAPVDVDDPAAVRWLRACLWPHDALRRARFDAAIAHARAARWPVRATTDATAAVEAWVATLPADVLPVVFNSWVLAYFEPAARAAHAQRLQALVAARGVAWVSAEAPGLAREWWPGLPAPVAPPEGRKPVRDELDHATTWTVAHPDGRGGLARWCAARSHAHGKWLQWQAHLAG